MKSKEEVPTTNVICFYVLKYGNYSLLITVEFSRLITFVNKGLHSCVTMSNWTCVEDILRLAQHPQYQDVTIVCKNGKISFNSIVLASMSPLVKNAFSNIPATHFEEMMTIICQDSDTGDFDDLFISVFKQSEEIKMCKGVLDMLCLLDVDVKKEKKMEVEKTRDFEEINVHDLVKVECNIADRGQEGNEKELENNVKMEDDFEDLDSFIDFNDPISEEENYSISAPKMVSHKDIDSSHYTVVTSGSEKSYKCNKCGRSYTDLKGLKRHVQEKHFTSDSLICSICNVFKTPRKDNLTRHMKTCKDAIARQVTNYVIFFVNVRK